MGILQDIVNRFNDEADAIVSQIEFVEDSIVLPSLRSNANSYIKDLIPSFLI